MQAHITGVRQCPCCTCPDETMDHLVRCPHKDLTTKREILLTTFRRKGIKLGIPRVVMETISGILKAHTQGEIATPPEHPSLTAAVSLQQKIGNHLLFRGFLAKEWETTLDDFSVEHSSRKLSGLLKTLWIDYTDQIWRNRNDVTHHRQNKTQQAEGHAWAEKLHWFLQNPQVVAQQDHFLLNYTMDDVQKMSGRTRRKLAQNLETVQKALTEETLQRKRGQTVITSYFVRLQGSSRAPGRPPSDSSNSTVLRVGRSATSEIETITHDEGRTTAGQTDSSTQDKQQTTTNMRPPAAQYQTVQTTHY